MTSNSNKVLSPHLTIYRLPITVICSILPRICGIFLFFCFIVLSYKTITSVYFSGDISSFETELINLFSINLITRIIQIALFTGFTFSFYLYNLSLVRHLFMDFGFGFEVKTATFWATVMLLSASIGAVLTSLYFFM